MQKGYRGLLNRKKGNKNTLSLIIIAIKIDRNPPHVEIKNEIVFVISTVMPH